MSIKTESFDLTFGSIHYAGTRLTIPIDDDEYMVYRVEIANHRRGSSSLVTFHLGRETPARSTRPLANLQALI